METDILNTTERSSQHKTFAQFFESGLKNTGVHLGYSNETVEQ